MNFRFDLINAPSQKDPDLEPGIKLIEESTSSLKTIKLRNLTKVMDETFVLMCSLHLDSFPNNFFVGNRYIMALLKKFHSSPRKLNLTISLLTL